MGVGGEDARKNTIDIRSVRYVLFTGSFYMSLRALKLIHNGRGEGALLFGRIVSLSINLHWTTILKYPRQWERRPRRRLRRSTTEASPRFFDQINRRLSESGDRMHDGAIKGRADNGRDAEDDQQVPNG